MKVILPGGKTYYIQTNDPNAAIQIVADRLGIPFNQIFELSGVLPSDEPPAGSTTLSIGTSGANQGKVIEGIFGSITGQSSGNTDAADIGTGTTTKTPLAQPTTGEITDQTFNDVLAGLSSGKPTTTLSPVLAEAGNPEAAWTSFLRNNGINPSGLAGSLFDNAFSPALAAFKGGGATGTGGIGPDTPFTQYLGSGVIGGAANRQLAQQTLPSVFNSATSDPGFAALGAEGGWTDKAKDLLAHAFAASNVNPFAKSLVLPSVGGILNRLNEIDLARTQGGTLSAEDAFSQYLRQIAGPAVSF